ncbi:MAG: tetratricopeptide repeat protein [Peptococcaceae bacterium]|nr:tetratricopeptide repeat protein [Peptococcaceae bacterium]
MLKFSGAATKTVKPSVAVGLLLATLALVIGIGLSVGYLFFWNVYDHESKAAHDLRVAVTQVKDSPGSVDAHLNLGWQYVKDNDYVQALAQYQMVLQLDPGNEVARYNIDLVKIQTGDLQDAKTDLESLQRVDPKYWSVRATLGALYRQLGEDKLAVQEFELLNTFEPGQVDILYQLGQAYQAMGNKAKAKAAYNSALSFNPADRRVKQALATLN